MILSVIEVIPITGVGSMWSITGEESDVNLAVELWLQVSKRREIKILERRSRRQKRMQRS